MGVERAMRPKGIAILVLALAAIIVLTAVFWGPPSCRRSAEDQRPRSFRVERPSAPKADDLATTLRRLLESVVQGEDVTEEELMEELLGALDREEVGVAELRELAAEDVASAIMNAALEFDGGQQGSEAMRQQALRQQSAVLLGELYLVTQDEAAATLATFAPLREGYRPLPWEQLADIDYKEGDPLPDEVRALDGQRVAVRGFLVEGGYQELLLVKSLWSCCFGFPPAADEVVVVRMEGPVDDRWLDGVVRVVGTLEVSEEREGDLVLSIYRMQGPQVDLPQ